MYVCRYTATTVSFRYTPLVSWDLLIRHGNHSPCLLLRKTHLFCSFLFRIIDPRLFFNQSLKTPLTRVFWFFPQLRSSPAVPSGLTILQLWGVGELLYYTLWGLMFNSYTYGEYTCESWPTSDFFLFPSLCSEPDPANS